MWHVTTENGRLQLTPSFVSAKRWKQESQWNTEDVGWKKKNILGHVLLLY